MRIIQLQLYVLMWCQAAETLDLLTDLGQNVTVNCDLDAEDVYWILLKQSESPTVILQSFPNTKLVFHFNKTFKNKYSVQSKHRLVIYNVTEDELGVYYCMNRDTPPKLSDSTRLHITEQNQLCDFNTNDYNDHTKVIQENLTQWRTYIILISGVPSAVLIITGLLYLCVVENGCWRRSENRDFIKTDLRKIQVTEQPQNPNQYVTVVFKAV